MTVLQQQAVKGTLWAALDKFSTLGIQFVVNMVLARLLVPEAFGVIGIIYIFIAVSQSLVDGGFGAALIQKKYPTRTDYSSVLWLSLLISIFLYGLIWVCSPLVAQFFHMEQLTSVLRGLALVVIFTAPNSIMTNYLRKRMEFKRIAMCTVSAITVGGSLAIVLAHQGFGPWSLVAMMVSNYAMQCLMLIIVSRWRPKGVISMKSVKELFGFGGYLLIAGLVQEFCKNLQGIVIGRFYSATQMGYYSQAQKFDQVCSYTLPQVLMQPMYPVYSRLQDDDEALAGMLDTNVRLVSFIFFPLMMMLILMAPWLLPFLFGDQWIPAIPYYQILCVGGLATCMQNINFYAVAAKGKSRVLFWWSLVKWGGLMAGILIGAMFSMEGLLWGMVIGDMFMYIINSSVSAKYVHYPLRRQLAVVLRTLSLVAATGGLVWLMGLLMPIHPLVQGLLFAALYICVAFALRLKVLGECGHIFRMLTGKLRRAPRTAAE